MLHRCRVVLVSFAIAGLIVDACGSATTTPSRAPDASGAVPPSVASSGPAGPSGSVAIDGPAGSSAPVADGPWPGAWRLPALAADGTLPERIDAPAIAASDLAPVRSAPLPAATLTDPLAIGDGLFDPGRVPTAVVSLLSLMRVGIVAPGTTGSGPLWLTEDEVRGLIAMGVEDARAIVPGMPGGGPHTFADLHAALAPMLPGMTVGELATRYAQAYDAHPGDLIPQVFQTVPVAPETTMTRVHLWLLLVDGFVPPTGATAEAAPPGTKVAASPAGNWGTAGALQAALVSPDPRLSMAGYTQLLAHLPMLGWTIPFEVVPRSVSAHEGHGGRGQTVSVAAHLGLPGPGGIDPLTGQPLLLPTGSGLGGVPLRWSSNAESVLAEHGSLDRALSAPASSDPAGMAQISYQPRQEQANNRGDIATDIATLDPTLEIRDLVMHHFLVPAHLQGLLFGTRTAPGMVIVRWHQEVGLHLSLSNLHNVHFDTGIITGGASRFGLDKAEGVLIPQGDGTYRGTLVGAAYAERIRMEAFGSACDGDLLAFQALDVVGRPTSVGGPTGSAMGILEGTADGGDLHLTFYPAEDPTLDRMPWCMETVDFPGGGPDNRLGGTYAPFNDSRWTTPDVGYTIHLPAEGTLRYRDSTQAQVITGSSVWFVDATQVKPAP